MSFKQALAKITVHVNLGLRSAKEDLALIELFITSKYWVIYELIYVRVF